MSLDVYFRDDILNILRSQARANPQHLEALICVALAFGLNPEDLVSSRVLPLVLVADLQDRILR